MSGVVDYSGYVLDNEYDAGVKRLKHVLFLVQVKQKMA